MRRPTLSTQSMFLLDLPNDILFHIFTFVEPNQLLPLWRSCKAISNILNEDRLWVCYSNLDHQSENWHEQRKEIDKYIQENNTNWKEYYRDQFAWAWSSTKKADAIVLSNNDRTASRPEGGSNPAALATKPFTRRHNIVCVKVDHLANWLGIGLCDERLTLNDSAILGGQSGSLNGSLFHQGNSKIKMRYPQATNSEPEQTLQNIKTGDVVTVHVDFDALEVKYFVDGQLVGKNSLVQVKDLLMEGKIFPAIDISQDTQVSLVPRQKFKMVDELSEKLGELSVA